MTVMSWNLSRRRQSRNSVQHGRRSFRPTVEILEKRLLLDVDSAITVPAPAPFSTTPQVWVDTDITGNTATSLGSEQIAKRVESTTTFQVDVVGYKLPAFGAF